MNETFHADLGKLPGPGNSAPDQSQGTPKAPLSPTHPANPEPIPRSPPQYAKRSGTDPKQALKAITQVPRAKRESSILPRAFLRAQDRSRGAHPIRQAERDRSEASIEGDHQNPSRIARKLYPPPSLPASAGPIPRSPQMRQAEDPSRPRLGTVWGYAAFLQNAPVVRHTRGFTPGWYAVPRWGTPKAHPPPSLPASTGPIPRSPQIRQAERDRSKASIGTSSPYSPSRDSAKAQPVPTFPASTGPIPRSPPQYARRSGTGPKQALKAITKIPRAKRESSILPRAFLRAKDRSRGAHPQYAKRSGIGPEQALKAISQVPRAKRESSIGVASK